MNLFIDTSTLVKRYIDEIGSTDLNRYFEIANDVFISQITKIEYTSDLTRRKNENSIDNYNFKIALNEFLIDYNYFSIIDFSSEIERLAFDFILNYNLRSLDSIQLASAYLCKSDFFLTSDKKLYNAAQSVLSISSIFI